MKLFVLVCCLCLPTLAYGQTATSTSTATGTVTATSTATATSSATTTVTSTDTATGTTTATATGPVPPAAAPVPPDAAQASDELLKELLAVAPHLGVKSGKVTCQLASAVSALQYDFKENDLERVALMEGWGCTYRSTVPVGAAIYGGLGLSKNHPNAFQTSILFSLYDLGAFGPGIQIFKNYDGKYTEQILITLALNLNIGVSLDTLLKLIDSFTGKAMVIQDAAVK